MKKRSRNENQSPCVIWDIDDTLVVIRGSVRLFNGAERSVQQEIARSAEDYLLSFLDKEFYFSQTAALEVAEHLKDWEKSSVLDEKHSSHSGWSGKRYAALLRRKYEESRRNGLSSDQTSSESDRSPSSCHEEAQHNDLTPSIALPHGWSLVLEAMEEATGNWTKHARDVLTHLREKNCRNVIVTSSELAPAMAKLMLWGLSSFFSADDIYSSASKCKKDIFDRVLSDLKSQGYCLESVCACGDGLDEERASVHHGIPFKRITCAQDLLCVPGLVDSDLAMDEEPLTSEEHSSEELEHDLNRKEQLVKRVKLNLLRYSAHDSIREGDESAKTV
jgi:phosphoglycolate phosphatase-like HAD superfamily hydrolase